MKNCWFFLFMFFFLGSFLQGKAQCSICTKTTQQLGEKPAKALNTGIIYLAFAPLAICGIIGYRWWKSNGDQPNDDQPFRPKNSIK
ncbi:hypothetical protein ACX0G9_30305 [Flavitalea flava]